MQGWKKMCVLVGVLTLLMMALFTLPGFSFPGDEGQANDGENSGDEDTGLTIEDIFDYIKDWLRGDTPGEEEGEVPNEGEVPDGDEGVAPDGGEVPDTGTDPGEEAPTDELVPPADETAPGQGSAPAKTREEATDNASEVPGLADDIQDELEETTHEPGSISGCKFLDADLNGCRDEGEPGIEGVGIRLEDGCKTWRAITAADGSYAFTGLEPGTYEVEVVEDTVPAGHFHTSDPDEGVCLKPEHMHRTVDFGNGVRGQKPGSICGRKWRDGDADGEFSFCDSPMAGVEIQLWRDGQLLATRTTSDACCDKGSYCFDGLEPGVYTVREVSPDGYYPTCPAGGEWAIELHPGEKRDCVNFLNARSLSISGTKWGWSDKNGDGLTQDGERYAVEGVTIELTSLCCPEPVQAVTGVDGKYAFDQLAPGIYTVREAVPSGWYAVDPACACRVVELLCDYDHGGVDFVNARRPSISGNKYEWVDGNGNSAVDNGEYYAVEGVEIKLLQGGVEVKPSAFSDESGSYAFAGLQPGTYTVSEVLTQGWYAMEPAGGTRQVEVKAGVDAGGVDFLNSRVEVAGEVVTPPVTPSTVSQAAGELPQTGINQVPFILASLLTVLLGLLFLALGLIRSRSS